MKRPLTWIGGFAAGAALGWILTRNEPRPSPPINAARVSGPRPQAAESEAPGNTRAAPGGRTTATAASSPVRADSAAEAPPEHAVVYGLVSSSRGGPVPGAAVTLELEGGAPLRVVANDAGLYSVAGVRNGHYNVKARAEGFAEASEALEVGFARRFERVDLTLAASVRIAIRFVDGKGHRLTDVLAARGLRMGLFGSVYPYAVASMDPLPSALPEVPYRMAFQSPAFQFRDVFQLRNRANADLDLDAIDGVLELRAGFPIRVAAAVRALVFGQVTLTEPVPSLDLEIDGERLFASLASLRCQVVESATGAAVSAARVSLADRQGGGVSASCDADGFATIENVFPGLLVLSVAGGEGLESRELYVRIERGQAASVRVELQGSVNIRGVVVDPGGTPVKGSVMVQLVPEEGSEAPSPWDLGFNLSLDDKGGFGARVGRRPYFLAVRGEGLVAPVRRIDPSSESVDDLRVVVVKGTPVTIRGAGSATERPLVRIRDASHRPVWSGYMGPHELPLTLAPGEYRAEVWKGASATTSLTFSVAESPAAVTIPY